MCLLGLYHDPVSWAHVSLNHYMEGEKMVPQILKESCCERIVTLKPTKRMETCLYTGLRTDKDMGNFGACFWLIAWW